MKNRKKYLVTPALPYANGPCHLGHLVEYIQTNIFVRALRMIDADVLYVCGADSHGTPIEMNALKAGMKPDDFAKKWQRCFENSFKNFYIEFDGGFGTTHSETNQCFANEIYLKLKDKGLLKRRSIEQLYDPVLNRFLPDRMVRGTCPFCKSKDQYGDSCESCGKTYSPSDLIEPKSALSGATPILKSSERIFFSLSSFTESLKAWSSFEDTLQEDTKSFLNTWFEEGLKDWDISRDGPYFGFLIPGENDKYFYVWLDAPIGYISLSDIAAKNIGRSFRDYWLDENSEIIHFIGKDIVYFHTLFWPALLMGAELNLPRQIIVHGMLTINGEKMSKSRGTFISADVFSKHIEPEALRYYYACKLARRSEDIDLNFSDFIQRVNTDLVNKLINLISRTLPLIHRHFLGKAAPMDENSKVWIDKAIELKKSVFRHYQDNESTKAVHEIVRFAEEGNKFLQDQMPWKNISEDPRKSHHDCTVGLYIGKVALGLLKPVLPKTAKHLEDIINQGVPFDFNNLTDPINSNLNLKEYEHLIKRIEQSSIDAILKETASDIGIKSSEEVLKHPMIDIEKFLAIDLRVAKVIDAKPVEGSDKLITCDLDVGPLGKRNVFSGLRPKISPEELIGKMVVLVANLAPRKMRFGVSEGMILASGEDDPRPIIIEKGMPGDKVR